MNPGGAASSTLTLLPWLLAAAPLVILPGHVDFARLPQQTFIQASALLLVFLWVLRGSAAETSTTGCRVFDVPMGLFLALSLVSLGVAHDPAAGLKLATHWVSCALIYGLVSRSVTAPARGRALVAGLFGGGTAVAAVGLAQALAGFDLVPQAAEPAGTLANRNVAAGYLVVILPLGLALWRTKSPVTRAMIGMGAAVILAFLPLTLSRNAAIALALQIVCLSFLWSRRRRSPAIQGKDRSFWRGVAAVGVALLLGTVVFLTVLSPPKARSVAVRASLARSALSMAWGHPLQGVGLGNFGVHHPVHGEPIRPDRGAPPLSVQSPHNEALQVLAETGVPGLLALLWLGWVAASTVARLLKSRHDETRLLAGALGLSLVGFGVGALVGFPLRTATGPLAAATLLGLLAGLVRGEGETQRSRRSSGVTWPRRRMAWAAIAALILVAATTWSARQLLADRALYRLRQAEAVDRLVAAVRAASSAARLDPFHLTLKVALARAHLRLGSASGARPLLEEALARRPWDSVILGNLGLARLAGGDGQGAAALFARIQEIDPADERARVGLAHTASRSGHDSEATEVCPSAVEVRSYGDARIDLVTANAPLADVLACLADRTGVQVEYVGPPPRQPVSATVRGEPLVSAVEGLLEGLGLDYALGLDPSRSRVVRIIIVGSDIAEGSRSRPSRPTPGVAPSAPVHPQVPGQDPGAWDPSPTGEPPPGPGGYQGVPDFPVPAELSPTTLRRVPPPDSAPFAWSRGHSTGR